MKIFNNFLGPYREIVPGLPQIHAPEVQTVMDHWLDLYGNGILPSRQDLDPLKFHKSLPHVWIYRYHPDQDDFICELAGDEINNAWNRNITGETMRALFSRNIYEILHARWRYVLSEGVIMKTDFQTSLDQNFKRAERLTLPMRDEGDAPICILGVTFYEYERYLEQEKDIAPPDQAPRYYRP